MLIRTQNDWNIGKIWNPFTSDYTEEFKEEMRKDEIKKKGDVSKPFPCYFRL